MPFKVKRAIITAAGPDQRRLPLQTLTDAAGNQSSVIHLLIDEILNAGVEEIALVLAPADRRDYETALAAYNERVRFIEQNEPQGYGHAVLLGREFASGDPFLLQVCDHIYLSGGATSCTRQLIEIAEAEACSISAVQATHESQLPYYGTINGNVIPNREGMYQIDKIFEKPTPTVAEQECVVPGLRHGTYLCFFGMHVLTPGVFDLLEAEAGQGQPFGLSPALNELAASEQYLATELNGRRANLEVQFGFLRAQVALGLHGAHREEVLTLMMEELAHTAVQDRTRIGGQ